MGQRQKLLTKCLLLVCEQLRSDALAVELTPIILS